MGKNLVPARTEKSLVQLVYEYIELELADKEFTFHDILIQFGTQQNISTSLSSLCKRGALECVGIKSFVSKNYVRKTRVYVFNKHTQMKWYGKPPARKLSPFNKKPYKLFQDVKAAVVFEPPKQEAPKFQRRDRDIITQLLDIALQVESLIKELESR